MLGSFWTPFTHYVHTKVIPQIWSHKKIVEINECQSLTSLISALMFHLQFFLCGSVCWYLVKDYFSTKTSTFFRIKKQWPFKIICIVSISRIRKRITIQLLDYAKHKFSKSLNAWGTHRSPVLPQKHYIILVLFGFSFLLSKSKSVNIFL